MKVSYPKYEVVEKAHPMEVFRWYMYLSSPGNDEQVKVLNLVCTRCKELGGITDEIKEFISTGVKKNVKV